MEKSEIQDTLEGSGVFADIVNYFFVSILNFKSIYFISSFLVLNIPALISDHMIEILTLAA
jgi:hypothetical protein